MALRLTEEAFLEMVLLKSSYFLGFFFLSSNIPAALVTEPVVIKIPVIIVPLWVFSPDKPSGLGISSSFSFALLFLSLEFEVESPTSLLLPSFVLLASLSVFEEVESLPLIVPVTLLLVLFDWLLFELFEFEEPEEPFFFFKYIYIYILKFVKNFNKSYEKKKIYKKIK